MFNVGKEKTEIKEFSIMADFHKSYLELLLCLAAQKLVKLKGGKQKQIM